MRVSALLALACLACVAGDVFSDFAEDAPIEYYEESFVEAEPETVLLVDESTDGSLRVTKMMQSFRLDGGYDSPNELLERPRTSFLDVTWSSWVDDRLEMFDLLQALLAPRPRCPHMQASAGSLDTSMVSYLASSRFGPAILTTYAQSFLDEDEEEEDDFDYAAVNLPEGTVVSKSYEDASLLEGLSADADRAFEHQEERMLSQQQQPELGFFGTNLRSPQDQVVYMSVLDGDSESLQPSILLQPSPKLSRFERQQPAEGGDSKEARLSLYRGPGLVVFTALLAGCIYVWGSLIASCCRMSAELQDRKSEEAAAAQKLSQQELLVPLMAEKAAPYTVEVAASHAPRGTYYAPAAAGYTTVPVPLMGN